MIVSVPVKRGLSQSYRSSKAMEAAKKSDMAETVQALRQIPFPVA
jgi:hypothetical protein